ncbi:MAG: nonstructural protein [Microviridae sp.]|nr:MAG: nonstructural protein [Microviridae sp.]
MDKNLYSIYDKISQIYAPPFVEITDGTAIRACTDLLQRQDLPFGKYPKDYHLVRIGKWEETEAHATPTTNTIIIEFETLLDSTKKE